MVLISLAALAVAIGIFAIAKYIENLKKNRLPAGIKRLPGPKGEHQTAQELNDIRTNLMILQVFRSSGMYMSFPRRTVG